MKQLIKFRHDILRFLPLIISGIVLAWCGFYLLFGASSIFTLRTLKVQQATLSQAAEKLVADRKVIEDRVVRMRPDSLDWDLVEQQAQIKLAPPKTNTKSLKM